MNDCFSFACKKDDHPTICLRCSRACHRCKHQDNCAHSTELKPNNIRHSITMNVTGTSSAISTTPTTPKPICPYANACGVAGMNRVCYEEFEDDIPCKQYYLKEVSPNDIT